MDEVSVVVPIFRGGYRASKSQILNLKLASHSSTKQKKNRVSTQVSCYAFKPLTRPVGCVSLIASISKGNAAVRGTLQYYCSNSQQLTVNS